MRIQAIDEALRQLEPVNMRAIDEYNEVELRLSDLQGKRDTLFTEREQLLERIDQYEQLKRDAFMEAYTSINANFKEIFHELSDGVGELLLDDPDDPFAGGMTIQAQPRKKTLQRIEAMSGGEKKALPHLHSFSRSSNTVLLPSMLLMKLICFLTAGMWKGFQNALKPQDQKSSLLLSP